MEPLGFFDFVRLEQEAFCILSDCGTVQEEACLFRKPNVTIRDVTERPETIECGSNILSGADPEAIARCVALVTGRAAGMEPPAEYLMENVAETVVQIVLGLPTCPIGLRPSGWGPRAAHPAGATLLLARCHRHGFHGAGSSLRGLARDGHQVTVLSGSPSYTTPTRGSPLRGERSSTGAK